MKTVLCPIYSCECSKYGKTKAGSQRWHCGKCSLTFTQNIDNSAKQLQLFLRWLFSKQTQKDMPGEGRTFRRKTSHFWEIWPMPPLIEEKRDVLYVDGIYLAKRACVLICCDETHVLGWYLCRQEHSGAWMALMKRIAAPEIVVSDGGKGFAKALKKTWPRTKHQRCIFHVFSQVKRYTTDRPQTAAGNELLVLAKDLLKIKSRQEKDKWIERFIIWMEKYHRFLSQITYDERGQGRPTHERLLKAQRAIMRLLREGTMFTYMFSQSSILTCMACGEYFVRHSSRQQYCSNPNCQAERNNRKARAYYKRKKEYNPK